MAFDVEDCLTRGGEPLIRFLSYCVLSTRVEAVAAYLIREYQAQPTAPRAAAIYECFLAPAAPARPRCGDALPPRNVRFQRELESLIERWRLSLAPVVAPAEEDEDAGPPPAPVVPKYLFDALAVRLRQPGESSAANAERSYDPELTPTRNLPGGRMNEGQRYFVDRVWMPLVRPRLTAAGFWKVANIPRS